MLLIDVCFLDLNLQAAAGAVRLEGDVITANGSIISGHIPREMASSSLGGSLTSVCSCRCPKCPLFFRGKTSCGGPHPPRRLTLTKSPAKITHLGQGYDHHHHHRKSISVAVYHRHPSVPSAALYPSTLQSSAAHHGHIMPSDSFELSPSRSPSPILELYDSPYRQASKSKRMSV